MLYVVVKFMKNVKVYVVVVLVLVVLMLFNDVGWLVGVCVWWGCLWSDVCGELG